MASLLSPRRTDDPSRTPLALSAAEASRTRRDGSGDGDDLAPVGWPVAAVVGGLCTAAATWILVAGLVVGAWLLTDPGTLPGALQVGTQLWLLGNGVATPVGGLPVTLVPWGITALVALLLSRFGGYAARRVRPGQDVGPALVTTVLMAAYALPVLAVAIFAGAPWLAPLHWAAVLVVLTLAAASGSARGLGVALTERWPGWLQGVPRAVLGAQSVLLLTGLAVLATSLVVHRERVVALTEALAPGAAGGVFLVLAQLTVLPNAVTWSTSYALGAGFTLGNGSVVAPAATQLGAVPGIPLLAALPGSGPGSTHELWWLGAGVLAGAFAAWLALRGRTGLRFDLSSLLGGLAGVLSGLVLVGVAWATSGDLGTVRLAGLGPRLLPLTVMAATTLGLSGMITGLVVGLLRRRR